MNAFKKSALSVAKQEFPQVSARRETAPERDNI